MPLPINFSAVLSELLAQFLFVFICTGCATGVAGTPGWVQQVSLTFGLTITVLAYTIGGRSGGHINGAVTLGLFAAKQIKAPNGSSEYKDAAPQALANIVAQLLGSTIGSAALSTIVDQKADLTGGLGTNGVSDNYTQGEAFFGEVIMTFVLMYVVLETACNPKNAGNIVLAPVAIGFAVYLGHVVLIPIDGCSINPTRSFGPAVVASAQGRKKCGVTTTESIDLGDGTGVRSIDSYDWQPGCEVPSRWNDWWVWTFGPCIGALIAVAYYKLVEKVAEFDSTEQQVGTDLEGGSDAAKAFEKVSEFAGKMAADGQANPCEGLENAAQLELFVDHSKKVVEHIEHQAKAHEARVLTAAARKQLQEIDDTAVGGPGGDE